MEEQVVVRNVIHAAVSEQYVDMPPQFLAHGERVVQLLHQVFLLLRQAAGVCRVHCRERAAFHPVHLAVHGAGGVGVVHGVEQLAVLHAPCRVFFPERRLHLELYHGDGLVHHGAEPRCLLVDIGRSAAHFRHEFPARVVGVGLHGEGGERHEVDAVALLESCHVGIP